MHAPGKGGVPLHLGAEGSVARSVRRLKSLRELPPVPKSAPRESQVACIRAPSALPWADAPCGPVRSPWSGLRSAVAAQEEGKLASRRVVLLGTLPPRDTMPNDPRGGPSSRGLASGSAGSAGSVLAPWRGPIPDPSGGHGPSQYRARLHRRRAHSRSMVPTPRHVRAWRG